MKPLIRRTPPTVNDNKYQLEDTVAAKAFHVHFSEPSIAPRTYWVWPFTAREQKSKRGQVGPWIYTSCCMTCAAKMRFLSNRVA